MQIIVDGLLTEYDAFGDAASPTLLVLHGWADSSVSWRKFAYLLGKDYQVIVPNLPGFGGSQAPQDAWGLEDYALFIGNFCTKLHVNPATIIAHSNGGAIAIYGLANGIFETGQLVLLASAGIRTNGRGRKRLIRLLTKTGKVLTRPLPVVTQQKLRNKLYRTIGSDLLVAAHMQETFKRVVAQDVQNEAVRIAVPTLLIYGDQDTATPLVFGQQLHALIPASSLEIITGVDHFIHIKATERVVVLIHEFLK